jgi:hypothetical protein
MVHPVVTTCSYGTKKLITVFIKRLFNILSQFNPFLIYIPYFSKTHFNVTPIYTWLLNVAVEWLTLLVRVREVPGSNLGPETGSPD